MSDWRSVPEADDEIEERWVDFGRRDGHRSVWRMRYGIFRTRKSGNAAEGQGGEAKAKR